MADEYEKVFDGEYGSYLDYPEGDNDRILAGLCYIFGWIVSLVVLVGVKPQSPFLRFHAIQALGLQIFATVLYLFTYMLTMILIGICLLPFVLVLAIYILVIGIMILLGNDHRVPWLADYIEENYI